MLSFPADPTTAPALSLRDGEPTPVLALRWDAVPERSLAPLTWDPRVELLIHDAQSPEWVPLARRMAGLLVAARSNVLRAFCFAVTAEVRLPIVMAVPRATAMRADLLAAGANACVELPIDAAGVDTMLPCFRRHAAVVSVDPVTRLLLDPLNRTVRHHGIEVRLAPREYSLLQCLSAFGGRPVSAEELQVHVWGHRRGSNPRQLLEVTIYELRRKLARIGLGGAVVTVRRYGYALTSSTS